MVLKHFALSDFRRTNLLKIVIIKLNFFSFKSGLESTANISFSDYDGRCPLHIAAAENNEDVVNLLFSWNADINSKDNYSNTPLSDALKAGNTELAKLIHSKGGGLMFIKFLLN